MVIFTITLRNGDRRELQAADLTWFDMMGFHNYGLIYSHVVNGKRVSPVYVECKNGPTYMTFVDGNGYEVQEVDN